MPEAVAPDRDPNYETKFLHEAAKTAEKRFGISAVGFELAVAARLEMGERLYQGRFLARPARERATEIMEEAHDAAAYAALDAQVRLVDDLDDQAAWRLWEIAIHAAAIDAHARGLRADTP